jgi:probable selenium-dependent hydroxylase accessory protein YqeC
VTASLRERIGLGTRELVAIVGAGGKSMILSTLGRELSRTSERVILTTTTMMATEQVTEPICWSVDPAAIDASFISGVPLWIATGRVPGKITGPPPGTVDLIFNDATADHVIVEADGARSKSIKAPAEHEPAIPSRSTIVVVVVAAGAINRPICDVAHRPERVAEITGLDVEEVLTVPATASLLLDPNGGLKAIPDTAATVMAITQVTPEAEQAAVELAGILADHPGVSRVVLLPTL